MIVFKILSDSLMWFAIVTFSITFLLFLAYVLTLLCDKCKDNWSTWRNCFFFGVIFIGTFCTCVYYDFVFSDWDSVSVGLIILAWALWFFSALIETFINS